MVKKRASKYVIVIPGDTSAHEIALNIIKKFKYEIKPEKIERVIPYGKGKSGRL